MTAPQAQNNCKNLLQKLKNIASLVKLGNPSEDPGITINELGDALLCNAMGKESGQPPRPDSDGNSLLYYLVHAYTQNSAQRCNIVKEVINKLTHENKDNIIVTCPDISNDGVDNKFSSLLDAFKSIAYTAKVREGDRERKVKWPNQTIVVFDTCYDKNKAKKLAKALGELKNKLENNDDFKKFLVLLTASYAMASKKPRDFFYDSEWFYLFVRALAKKFAGDDVYISVCPSLGDAIALYYYFVINFEDVDPRHTENIGKADVMRIVNTLLNAGIGGDASNTGEQGTG